MPKQIIPIHDRVLVKPDSSKERQTGGGIIIPDGRGEKPSTGIVVAVGPGRVDMGRLCPMTVAVGDKIVYSKFGATAIILDGIEYMVLREDDILVTLHEY